MLVPENMRDMIAKYNKINVFTLLYISILLSPVLLLRPVNYVSSSTSQISQHALKLVRTLLHMLIHDVL